MAALVGDGGQPGASPAGTYFTAVTPAPDWLIERVLQGRGARALNGHRAEGPTFTDWDRPEAIARARDYLRNHAPEAITGQGGDPTTLQVCLHVRDLGCSLDTTEALVSVEWNEAGKAIPPWDQPDLRTKVENAFAYGKLPPGNALGVEEFKQEIAEQQAEIRAREEAAEARRAERKPPLSAKWVVPFDPMTLPRREWLLGRFLAVGFVAEFIAPPGAGKTTLEMQMAVALATGRSDITGHKVHRRCRVFLWNQEDDEDELNRRLAAVMKAFDVTFADLEMDGQNMLMIGSGVGSPLIAAGPVGGGRSIKPTAALTTMAEYLRDEKFDVAMFDPLAELHEMDENSNHDIKKVGQAFREIVAVGARTAVLLIHHTRKLPAGGSTGHEGNMDSGRGGGAMSGVARMVATFYGIDKKAAEEFGIPEEDRHRYVRFDDGKANMSLIAGEPTLYRREAVNIRTVEDPEEIGVLRLVAGVEKRKSNSVRRAEALLDDVAATVGEAGKMPVVAIADALIMSDPLYVDAKRDTLVKAIKRVLQDAKAIWSLRDEHMLGRPGRFAMAVRDVADKVADKRTNEADEVPGSGKDQRTQ